MLAVKAVLALDYPQVDRQSHRLCRPGGNACGGPPPAGVGGGNAAADRVVEQDGDAVSGEDGQADPRLVGDQSVGLAGSGLGGVGENILPGDRADDIAVNLVVFHQGLIIRPNH